MANHDAIWALKSLAVSHGWEKPENVSSLKGNAVRHLLAVRHVLKPFTDHRKQLNPLTAEGIIIYMFLVKLTFNRTVISILAYR